VAPVTMATLSFNLFMIYSRFGPAWATLPYATQQVPDIARGCRSLPLNGRRRLAGDIINYTRYTIYLIDNT
jgi:hypothetical protein